MQPAGLHECVREMLQWIISDGGLPEAMQGAALHSL